jgi:hypothetical protein
VHFSKIHSNKKTRAFQHSLHNNVTFKCTKAICALSFETSEQLEKHLIQHLNQKEKIKCPFSIECTKEITTHINFRVHKHRHHKNTVIQPSQSIDSEINDADFSDANEPIYFNSVEESTNHLQNNDFEKDFFTHLLNFIMKLEAEKLFSLLVKSTPK